MINSAAGIALLVIGIAAFNNYQRGTLRQWLEAKALNRAAPPGPGQQLIGAYQGSTVTGAGDTIAGGVAQALGTLNLKPETWRGVTLDASAMTSWKRMVLDAEADGVTLTGTGLRSNKRQIELRVAHGCGGDKIYDRNCKGNPPTAVPGRSLHEVGQAVDVANCRSRDTRVFKWLAANAAAYGWKNLPSEPWHWSTGERAGS